MKPVRVLVAATSLVVGSFAVPAVAQATGRHDAVRDAGFTDVSVLAEEIREDLGVPGLAVAASNAGGPIAIGWAGVREVGRPDPVQPNDPFHLGSLTKSMTATLVATFVEDGRFDWDATISDLDESLAEQIPERARATTIRQLLSHRSGIRDDPNTGRLVMGMWGLKGDIRERRHKASVAALNSDLNEAPGAGFAYSNLGYVVVGSILEQITGRTWEELAEQRVFGPLGLTSVGHGPPGVAADAGSTPNGHVPNAGGWHPLPRVEGADNPEPMGPAGRVHMSIEDLAEYGRFHLLGLNGKDGLLESETVLTMHDDRRTPGYALGWGRSQEGGTARSLHSGSNTRWLAFLMVWPDQDLVVAVTMNAAPAPAMDGAAIGTVVQELARLGLIRPLPEPFADTP